MSSTQTQIAGFTFNNCLMNAAGVACMTIEELEEVKNSPAGTFVTKMCCLAQSLQWGYPIMDWTIIWITC